MATHIAIITIRYLDEARQVIIIMGIAILIIMGIATIVLGAHQAIQPIRPIRAIQIH